MSTSTHSSAHPLIRSSAFSGAANMAFDVAMLRQAQRGATVLRLYRWDPPCLSFGRNEPALNRYDRGLIEQLGLDTVRRPTGGRAVWHNAEVTYAVAAPIEALGSLRDSYVAIHRMIARGLARLGVSCDLASIPGSRLPAPGAGSCFANPVGGEVVVDGRKLVGSAQVRDGSAFLQHGSILLEDAQDVVTAVTRGPSAAPAATSLSALMGRRVEFSEVAQEIVAEARQAWGIEPEDANAADPALVSQFRNPAWTWRK